MAKQIDKDKAVEAQRSAVQTGSNDLLTADQLQKLLDGNGLSWEQALEWQSMKAEIAELKANAALYQYPPDHRVSVAEAGRDQDKADAEYAIKLERALADVIVEINGCGPSCSKEFLRMGADSAKNIASKALRNRIE